MLLVLHTKGTLMPLPQLSGVIHDLPESAYHSRPELSSTGARLILDSPAKYQYRQTHPEKPKKAFDAGSYVHAKVLGIGSEIVALDFDSYRTKAAQEARDEAYEAGAVPMLTHELRPLDTMAESVLAHPEARHILETVAGREVSIITHVDGVPVRARFDIYDGTNAADLKTARDASPKGFNTSVGRYGYAIQEQWYREAHNAVTATELDSFKFLVVESTAPYLVGVYDLDFMWEDLAKERTKKARELWRRCTETGVWPGYASATLTPPTWAVFESEEQEIQV